MSSSHKESWKFNTNTDSKNITKTYKFIKTSITENATFDKIQFSEKKLSGIKQ